MAKLSIRPLDDRLVVGRVEAEEKTKGGIVLPNKAREKPKEEEVLALGTGKLLGDGNLLEAGIVDPTRVCRIALETAASVAGIFLTTEAVVCEIKDEEKSRKSQEYDDS